MDKHSELPEQVQNFKPAGFFSKNRVWLNILLFVLTVFSTFFVGFSWSLNYRFAEDISQNIEITMGMETLTDPQVILLSVLYAVTLIGILLGHELGHFLACRHYKLDATLPFFIPAPTLIGTMGAFIKIRSPITRKKQLFDVGIAGPLTGFVLAVPVLVFGLLQSKAVPALPEEGSLYFGEPLLLKILVGIFFKGTPADFDIILHPMAFAGWVGILVTALNLFPIGQLDGGHIIYAMFGSKSLKYTRWIIAAFIFMGIFFWVGWFVWAVLIAFLGIKHPRIADEHVPLDSGRTLMGILIVVIFILSFIPDPIQGYSLIDFLKQITY